MKMEKQSKITPQMVTAAVNHIFPGKQPFITYEDLDVIFVKVDGKQLKVRLVTEDGKTVRWWVVDETGQSPMRSGWFGYPIIAI